ncbi:S-layer homology domain-containing protein [Saccharibacillus sp. O23]|uniref:S-layer homology domain-containing protein n=1 Tax=Saccharibacillus sp. O23 TaxID=2009338 RepID=UPI001C52F003|nr:S-layer homology domain-containing protein [Saccharibacillus sp. O23]
MKKIVSLALSTAMAFSMFASVTSAATLTTQEKYNALVTQGIFAGYPNGEAYLDKDMTRAEFAKVVALLTGLDTTATTTSTYADPNYANAWYKPYVEAVTKAGYMKGTTTGTKKLFNPNGKVTVQEMAATLVRAAKLEIPTTGIDNGAAAWAKGEVQAAINAGLISKTANFAGAATRGLLVDTAYAYQTALSKPAVASYDVTDNGATVVFTLANGEKVTVKPTTALQPNVATTVTFKYNDFDYSESVTWKVTDASAVTSASASNLKEVMVMFNGKVDKTSAENINNYSIPDLTISSAALSADGTTVTLRLTESSTLSNNRQTTVTVNNVKQSTGSTLISGKATFTPSDVTIPTVSQVNPLGTGAVEVVFSEPVQKSSITVGGIRIDGAAVAANITPSYSSNSVIIETPLSVGDHTIRLSGVTDYSGLVMAPVDQKFTVVADTTAPTITSTTSNDLKEVTVTFSEPVRSIGSAYANSTSSTAQVSLSGRTATLTFPSNLSYSANTITLTGVTDYSGNTAATLTATVTPTLDLTAPTVVGTSVGVENNNYYVDVQFSKAVNVSDSTLTGYALNRDYYTLRNTAGTVVTGTGLTSAGHPVTAPQQVGTNGRTVRVTLGPVSSLTAGSYKFEVAGVRDLTTAQNVLTPYSTTISLTKSADTTLDRAWRDGAWVYLQFSGTVATSGNGNALEASKYRLDGAGAPANSGTTTVLTDRNTDVEIVGANTVRIYARNFTNAPTALDNKLVVASYVAKADGTYFTSNGRDGRVEATATISPSNSSITVSNTPVVNSDRQIVVTFNTPVTSIDRTSVGFTPAGSTTAIVPTSVTMSDNNKTATITLPSSTSLSFATGQLTIANVTDQFGNRGAVNQPISNNAKPVASSATATVTRTSDTAISVFIPTTREVTVVDGSSTATRNLFQASVGTTAAVAASQVSATTGGITATFAVPAGTASTTSVYVEFNGTANATTKLVVAKDADATPAGTFSVTGTAGTYTAPDTTAPTATAGTPNNATTLAVTLNEAATVTIGAVTGGVTGVTVAPANGTTTTPTFTIAGTPADGATFKFTVTDTAAAANARTYTATYATATTNWTLTTAQ